MVILRLLTPNKRVVSGLCLCFCALYVNESKIDIISSTGTFFCVIKVSYLYLIHKVRCAGVVLD